jgi:type VI secretion system protein ImpF
MSSGNPYRSELPQPQAPAPASEASDQVGHLPSMLDRLIDPESGGTAWRRGYGETEMLAAVRRDLEDLLNTRRYAVNAIDEYPETRDSVASFGMPDVSDLPAATAKQRAALGLKISEAVRRFEPRLTDVQVRLIEDIDENDRFTLKYQISARLATEAASEVNFETIVELGRGRSRVNSMK